MLPAAASTALRASLASPSARTGRVLAAFPSAVYIALHDPCPDEPAVLAVVTADGIRLPNALVVAAVAAQRPFGSVRAGQAARVARGAVHLPGVRVTAARWWDPRPRLRPGRAALSRTVPALAQALAAQPSAVADRLEPLALALAADDGPAAEAAAAGLLGLGPGLTPAGDDVLAGTLATLCLLLPPVGVASFARPRAILHTPLTPAGAGQGLAHAVGELAAGRTTALSAALLDCARRGQVASSAADLLRALTGDGDVAAATGRLVRVGHSSGRDLAAGVLLAAEAVAAAGAAARRAAADEGASRGRAAA